MKKTFSKTSQFFGVILLLICIPVFGHAAEWTVMVYLDADNNLESDGIDDFMEIATIGSNSSINYVVQMDRISGYDSSNNDWTDCNRFYVEKNMSPLPQNAVENLGEINMGDPDQLADFIQWSMSNYPAQRYALILWDHGDGWRKRIKSNLTRAICWDDTNGDGSGLSMLELKDVLTSLPVKPDLVGFDACLMAMIENAYMLKLSGVSVMVGSEETEPAAGWPYDLIARGLASNPSWSAIELGGWIVDKYYESYDYDETQSAIDLSKLDPVISALSNFASSIQLNWQDNEDSIRNAAQNLRICLDNSVINTKNGDAYSHAGGLSIYFPTTSYESQYDETDLSKETFWNEFLSDFHDDETDSCVSIVRNSVLSFYDEDFIDLRHFSSRVESYDPDDYRPLFIVEETGYNFTDIQSTGTLIEISDDSNVSINPPNFTFVFYGNVYDTFYISDNGVIFFSETSSGYAGNQSIPDDNSFNATFIAPFWDDFDDSTVYWKVQDNALIIQWESVFHYNTSSDNNVTFQCVLYNNGSISFQYKDTLFNSESYDYGKSATVGLQGSELRGIQYSMNTPAIQSPFALRFTPEDEAGCFYSLEAYQYNVSAQGESRSVSLSTKDECEWSVSTMNSWIQIVSETSGVGPALIRFQISENSDFVEREGALKIGNQTLTIFQESKCTFNIFPLEKTIAASGGSGSITINTNFPECMWNINNEFSWIHTSDISGTGDANLTYAIDQNPLYDERSGYIDINKTRIRFLQMPSEPDIIELTVCTALSDLSFNSEQRAYYKVELLPEHHSLRVATNGGTGDADIFMSKGKIPTKDENDYSSTSTSNNEEIFISEPESGAYYIMIYAYESFDNVTFSVRYLSSQCEYVISDNEFSYSNTAATGNFQVSTDNECSWYIRNDATWINILNEESFYMGNHTIQFSILENSSISSRNSSIYVNSQVITINQQGNSSLTAIVISAPVSDISGEDNQYQYFKINVPENQNDLIITTSGGTGDCDVYVRYNDFPDRNNYDYKSTHSYNDETISIENPQAGDYYILLYAYDPFSGVTLEARYEGDRPCNCEELTATIEAQALSIAYLKAELEKHDGYTTTLSSGWHLLNGLSVYAQYPLTNPENCIEAVFQYKEGRYQPVGSFIEPYQAIWVKVNEECTFILKKQRNKVMKK
jgi:hypothetical protein